MSLVSSLKCTCHCQAVYSCSSHSLHAERGALVQAEGPGEGCRQCALPCQRLRSCEHPCALACHPEACPECQEEVRLPCHCTRSTICLECIELQQVTLLARLSSPLGLRLGCHQPLPRLVDASRPSTRIRSPGLAGQLCSAALWDILDTPAKPCWSDEALGLLAPL